MTGRPRELSVDLYRVCAVVLIVMGHWLAASVAYRHGAFVRENPLELLPWTQWLTWIFQVVPVFFVVAGYAGAASWSRRGDQLAVSRRGDQLAVSRRGDQLAVSRRGDTIFAEWLGKRVRGVLGPTTAYVVVVLLAVGVAVVTGFDPSALATSGWAVAMHLWFIPVYLVVVACTPVAVALHRRWGVLAALALSVAVALVDGLSVSGLLPGLGWANNLLCWLALFQMGVAWFFGTLSGWRAIGFAAAGAAIAALALTVGPYPVSLIGVPGQVVQNSAPPSIVMLAVGFGQAGVLIAISPVVNRWLQGSVVRRPLAAANERIMLLYLWHMVAVVVVSVVAYPLGLFPQPTVGTGGWWLTRLLWLGVLAAVTVVVLLLVASGRSVLARDLVALPVGLPVRFGGLLLLAGAGAAAAALWVYSLQGFAPEGRFPIAMTLLYFAGIAVTVLRPSRLSGAAVAGNDPRRSLGVFGP